MTVGDATPRAAPAGRDEARLAVAALWDRLSAATVSLDAQERSWRAGVERQARALEAYEALERKRSDAWVSGALRPGDPWPELDEDLDRAERHLRAMELGVGERERELAAATDRHRATEQALAEAEASLETFGPIPEGELPWASTRERRRRKRRRRRVFAAGAASRRRSPERARARRRRGLPVGVGALATLASRMIGKGLSFGFIVVLARTVSPQQFASYSYLVALALTFSLLCDSGVAVVAGRDVARGDLGLGAAYRGGFSTVLAAGSIGALLVAAFGVVASGPGIPPMALVFTAAFVLVSNVSNFQADLIRGSGRLGLEAGLQVVGGVLFVVVGTVIVISGLGLVALMAAFTFKEILMVGISQLALPWLRSAPRTPGLWRQLLRAGIVMSAATTCLALLARASLLVLSNVASATETAHYAAAFRFGEISIFACVTLGFGLLPAMSDRYSKDRAAGARLALRLTGLTVGVALVITPPLVLITPWVVTAVFGPAYAGAGSSAEILVAMLPLLMLLALSWNALLADRRERSVLIAALAGVAAACVSSTWIVADPNVRTAALSAVISFGAVAVVCAWSMLRGALSLRRHVPPRRPAAAAVDRSDDVLT